MSKPKFDPNQPYQVASNDKPKFDPNQPYQAAEGAMMPSAIKEDQDRGVANALVDKFGQGISFGLMDEGVGGLAAALRAAGVNAHDGKLKNFTLDTPTLDTNELSKAYTTARDQVRSDQHQDNKFHPTASTIGEIAGGIANPLNRITGDTLKARLAIAAAQGGAYGFGNSNADDASGMLYDTAKGAAVSAALAPVATALSKASVPVLGEILTGVPRDASKSYLKHMDFVDQMARDNTALPFTENLTRDINQSLQNSSSKYGKAVGEAIDSTGGSIDLTGAKKSFIDRINFLQSKPNLTNAEQAEVNSLKSTYDKYFGLSDQTNTSGINNLTLSPEFRQAPTHLPDSIEAQRAFDLQQKLKQAAAFETGMTPETASAKGTARNAYHSINQSLDNSSQGLTSNAKADYANWKNIESELENNFSTPQKTYSTLTGLDAHGKKMLSERLRQLAQSGELNLETPAEQLQAYKYFAEPSGSALSSGGSTSTSRTKAGTTVAAGLGAGVGSLFGLPQAGAIAGAAAAPLVFNPANLKDLLKFNRWYNQSELQRIMPSTATMNATVPSSVYNSFTEK